MADKQYVSSETLATYIGLTSQRVGQLVKEGVFHPVKITDSAGRKFVFLEAVKDYITYLQERDKRRGVDVDAMNAAKLRESELRQRKLAVQAMLMEGEAHESVAVEAVMNDLLGSLRMRFRALPREIAYKVVAAPDEANGIRILAEEIDNVLAIAGDYRREDFLSRNAESVIGQEDEVIEGEGADAG